MWEDFHEAFVNGEHVVMGRKLRPYCAYHLFWLKLIGSPLIKGGNITLPDMEAATRICSCRYGEAQKVLKRRRSDYLKFLWKGVRYNLGEERDKFQAWSDDYNSPPTPEGGCQSSESTFTGEHLPHEIWIVTGLMTVLGLTEEQAWMTPLGKAEWYLSVSNLYREKGSNILLGQEREFREGIKKLREQKEAANGKTE